MDFVSKVKDLVDKGTAASMSALEKAGTAVQDFSDKSVLKIEIKQLETKRKNNCTKLGKLVSDAFLNGAETVSIADEAVKEVISEMKAIDAEIAKKQNELKNDGNDVKTKEN